MENSNYKNKIIERKYSNTWYDWLINYIPDPIRKIIDNFGFKDKIVSFFNTSTPKQTVHGTGKKLSKPKTQNNLKKTEIIALETLLY